MTRWCSVVVVGLVMAAPVRLSAAPVFFGPIPYLSAGDIPDGMYAGGGPTALETFEDGTLDFGMTASAGFVIPPVGAGVGAVPDSVDADDGVIDGDGSLGRSWFSHSHRSLTITFNNPVTSAGLVFTDGDRVSTNIALTTFEAFGPGMAPLGSIGPFLVGDSVFNGTTAEDAFFGVQDPGGIVAIRISNSFGALEIDHVQFGVAPIVAPVPEPSSLLIWGCCAQLGIGFLAYRHRRRTVPG